MLGFHRRAKAKTSLEDYDVPIDDTTTKPLFTPQEKGRKGTRDKVPRLRWNPWQKHVRSMLVSIIIASWWIKGERHMPFAVPMIWREPKDHSSDCYFCLKKNAGITSKSRHTVEYPDLPSAMRPVPHSDILPVPQPPENVIFSDDDSDRREQQWDDTNFEAGALSEPHLLTQGDLNDLVRDLDVSKKQSELLGSRLKGWNLLHKGAKVCFFRKCQDEFQDFFSQENDLVYCNDVVSLMEALGHDHDTEEWRLFIDSSKISMKAVLLHNGNKFPSVPIAHASNMKETYENMELLLKKIEYERYGWKICSDLKVIAFLRGLQLGYTKFCCFLYGKFQNSLNEVEAAAWNSFRNVCKNFLGSVKVENYRDIINNLLLSYKALGCNMSLKIHFLHSHLDFFPDNLGAVNDEHGERFHQDISSMEKRYQGKGETNKQARVLRTGYLMVALKEILPYHLVGNILSPFSLPVCRGFWSSCEVTPYIPCWSPYREENGEVVYAQVLYKQTFRPFQIKHSYMGAKELASSQRREKEKKFCSFCHKPNHSKEECWHYQKRNNSNKEYKYENFRRGNVPKYTNQSSVTQEQPTNQRTTKGPNPKALNCTQREASVHNWFVDSGATSHMAYDESFFTELNREQTQHVVVANGNKLQVKEIGQGEIKVITPQGKTDTLLLTKVLYIPELTDNLLSVSAATSNGCKVTFKRDWCTIERDNTALTNGILDNGIYTDSTWMTTSKLAHSKPILGHRNIESIKKIQNENLARGLSLNNCSHSTDCVQCIQGKLTETPFPKKTEYRANETLQLVHSDVCGPLPTNSLSVHTEFGKNIQTIRTDNGREYVNRQVEDFLNQSGIKNQLTVPYSPAQNGVAERKNRSLMEMTRCMLFDSGLPQSLWAEAVTTANYLHNHIPSKATDKTPFELWTNRKPSLKQLKRFGCKAFAYIPKIKRNKLDSKVIEGIFLGYDDRSKGYRILHDTDNITISRSVKFLEKENGFYHASTKTTSPQVLRTDLTSSNHIGNVEESQEPGTQSENLEDSETEDYIQPSTSTGTQVVTQRRSTRPTKGIPPIRNDYMLYKTEARDIQTPTNYSEVLQLPKLEREKWLQAMNEELNSLEKNNVWELTPLPKDKKIIGCKWTYKQKLNSKGEIERYKARLVAKGFNQKFGRDYEETFAPIVKHSTIRAFLAASVYKGMQVNHLDVKTAFLHGDLDKELYMELPEGLHTKQTNEVCKLKKAIYGLKKRKILEPKNRKHSN
ncbi:hypothetical protein LAZ67_14001794 [Cordylochernes scorpioides]|uniref:Integrase catalytic domain-containing protein n=1 Tax=Cordylochernes scorpioides TaxID=51811 RepID=A0ABY6L8Z1_9ARAC|nr:hypothetical protein LAZ67_14001794 [Cordylochernes scorpioides]